ncbi:MAG: VWA domain-containing protein [Erysipelotrichia bacterium]|nr:VWA domain-containing protein [Erysipelotrichia bacterium]
MKKRLILLLGVLSIASMAFSKDFASQITHINAAGFPKIEVSLKVFNKEAHELQSDNFLITEDGQAISSFALEFQKNRQFMVLVIDRSSSIEPAMNEVKRAAASFVGSMVANVTLSILSFGSDMDFNHDFSADGPSLIAAINKIRPWGGTALYDAIYMACEELQNKAGRNDLRTVVCLTDGRDSTPNGQTPMSTHTPAEVVKFATEKNIRIITVGLGNDIDSTILKGFASSTGGWYLQTTTPEELLKLYDALSRRMKLERHYRLAYTTPKPDPDGTKRTVEIASSFKGLKDQGNGQYTAPTRTVSIPEPSNSEEASGDTRKMSLTTVFSDLHIDGPDSVYLTSPIIVPFSPPVIGLNGASFLGSSREECQAIIDQARARISEEHKKNYDMQQKYLDGYVQSLDRLQKTNDERAASPSLKAFEKPRIDYRNQYLQMRREEIDIHRRKSYDDYLVSFKASMDELDYYQRTQVAGEPEESGFFNTNTASESIALRDVYDKYNGLLDQHHEKMTRYYVDTFDSRGANVEFTTHEQTHEFDLPAQSGLNSGGASVKNIQDMIDKKLEQIHENSEESDSESADEESELPQIDLLD